MSVTHWIGAFICSPDAKAAIELLVERTPAVAGVRVAKNWVNDPGKCRALAESISRENFLGSMAWAMIAMRPGDPGELNNDCTINSLIAFARMARAGDRRDEATARLQIWKDIVEGRRAAYGSDLFAFVESVRKRAPAPTDDEPVRAVEIAVDLLSFERWDDAARSLYRRIAAMNSGAVVEVVAPEKLLLSNDRPAVREAIDLLVSGLFAVGDVEAGKLAIAWLMLQADPARPAQFASFMPQLQRMLDEAVFTNPEQKKMTADRMEAWWDAADGEYIEASWSVFALAAMDPEAADFPELDADPKPNGFEAVRKASIQKPMGSSLVVMPTEKGSKLNNYHGAFKEIVDAALPSATVMKRCR